MSKITIPRYLDNIAYYLLNGTISDIYSNFNHSFINNSCSCIFYKEKQKTGKTHSISSNCFCIYILRNFFGDNRLIGYSLIGIGVLLAIIDIFKKLKKK